MPFSMYAKPPANDKDMSEITQSSISKIYTWLKRNLKQQERGTFLQTSSLLSTP